MKFLTRKEMMKVTGATHEQLTYLRLRGRLPLLNEPDKGIPSMFAPECVEIVKAWLKKRTEPAGR